MSAAIDLCLAGRIAPNVALARLVFEGRTPDEIAPLLPAGSALATLFAAQRERLDALADMLRRSGADHGANDGSASVGAIAAMFNRAVAIAPEASVAAYALGDAGLLAAATAELVDWLVGTGFAASDADVLDFGCGIGRVTAALAPRVRSVLGLDVSPGMIAEAERRHAGPSLRFAVTDGSPPLGLAAASLDLALAVDSMPYLVQAGVAGAHVAALRRLLRPRAHLVVLNLSYRGDDAVDLAEAGSWAAAYGFDLRVAGERPFVLWDGAAYVLRVSDRSGTPRASRCETAVVPQVRP